jgi:hypothetical protein
MPNTKNKMNKIIQIILIVIAILFVIENIYLVSNLISYNNELKKTNFCYYSICEEYPDAYYEDGVCFCYDYDILGELIVSKTEVLK